MLWGFKQGISDADITVNKNGGGGVVLSNMYIYYVKQNQDNNYTNLKKCSYNLKLLSNRITFTFVLMYTTVLSLHIMLYFNVNIVSDPLLYNYLSLYNKTAECGLVVQIFY